MIGIETPARQLLLDSITAIDWNARARAALHRLAGASGRVYADERYLEADAKCGIAASLAGPDGATQTSSEQNSSPHKVSACGGLAAARSDGSTGSLDPVNGRVSPAGAALEQEPSLDTALGLVAQSRTNLVALEVQHPAGVFPLRTDSPTLPVAALAAASRNLGTRRALSGSQSAPAFAPAFSSGPAAGPEPDPRPASRGSGMVGGDSGTLAGSRQQSTIEATLFPQPAAAMTPAGQPNDRGAARLPAPAAAVVPLWKRIEAAERAAADAADRAEAEAAGWLMTSGRRGPGDTGGRQASAAEAVPNGGVSAPRRDAARLTPSEHAAAVLQEVKHDHRRPCLPVKLAKSRGERVRPVRVCEHHHALQLPPAVNAVLGLAAVAYKPRLGTLPDVGRRIYCRWPVLWT